MLHVLGDFNLSGRDKIANMTGHNAQENKFWTEYWQTGAPVSCVASPEMEAHLTFLWDEFVDGLADGSRILDLATGNGIVALNCKSRARTRKIHLQVDAVDAADINPKICVKDKGQLYREVSFFGGIQLEDLPFADDCFSGVVSQFGFEYADEGRAVAEISRVLMPGGQLRLIIHAQDGAVSRDIGKRLERLKSVLAENGPVSLVLELARAAEVGDSRTLERKSKHIPTAIELNRRLADNPLPDDTALFYATEFLTLWAQRSRYRPADLRRSIEQGWFNASGTAVRQAQMLRAARSEHDIGRIRERFETIGLTIDTVSPVHDSHRNIQNSWMVNGRKH